MLDESGREVPAGTPGQLCFRDSTGRGLVYAIEGFDSDSSLGAGVFTLGEVGYVDDEGYVYITDRTADLVVSGGVNVYPAEVERVLDVASRAWRTLPLSECRTRRWGRSCEPWSS